VNLSRLGQDLRAVKKKGYLTRLPTCKTV
jgi:hypothetical protein